VKSLIYLTVEALQGWYIFSDFLNPMRNRYSSKVSTLPLPSYGDHSFSEKIFSLT